jgi:hypothetical protein
MRENTSPKTMDAKPKAPFRIVLLNSAAPLRPVAVRC